MRAGVLAGLVLAVGAAGCGDDGADPVAGVDLQPTTLAGLDAAVRERQGSVVLVDFWATTCGPCRERFPHLVELHRKYAPHGLAVVTLSLDEAGDEDRALRFLRRRGADCTNFFWAERTRAGAEGLTRRFGFAGGIPHMALFGRSGDRVWTSTDDPLSPEGVDRLVRDELARK